MKFINYKISTLVLALVIFTNIYSEEEKPVPAFYNEILKFSIDVKGISVGSILMRTVKTGNEFLQINTRVDTFDSLKGIYYISGNFGAMWNYKTQKSYMAYEDIYDGYMYMRRAYRFQSDNRVFVNKREVKFVESGLPHDQPPEKDATDEYYIDGNEYQDLIGIFYTLRSSGIHPKTGETYTLKVLPAGVKKHMIIQVIGKDILDVPALGGKVKVIHVKSGLANPNQKPSGGNIFFNVKSEVDIFFTDDENSIPVLISANVPLIKRVVVVLTDYQQTNKAKK